MKETATHAAESATAAATAASGTTHAWVQSADTWITLSFLICLGLALKYLVPVITKALDGRSDKIRDQLEQASRLRAEAQALLASYQEEQQAMLQQAQQIVAAAQKEAAELQERAASELKQAIERRHQQSQEKIARAEQEALDQLRRQTVTIATETARDIIAKQLQNQQDDKAVAHAIAAIERQIH